MRRISYIFRRYFLYAAVLLIVLMNGGSLLADDNEPIAFIGHGAFFSSDGRQIDVTLDFIESVQTYYRQKLTSSMTNDKNASAIELEKRASQISTSSRQNRLLLQNSFLASIASDSTDPDVGQIRAKLNALNNALKVLVPEHAPGNTPLSIIPRRKFVPDSVVRDIITKQSFSSQEATILSSTTSAGQKYIDECLSNGVPIPPPMGKIDPNGKVGWKSLGFIPKDAQFIVGTPAEVRVFISDSPAGMCFALPRYVDDSLQEIELDGAICLGQLSSKVCIWDNQMPTIDADGKTNVEGFVFSTGDQIPIGVPDLKIDPKGRYQAGGAEIENGTGGVCTNCHAGENPYIIHPKADLGGGLLMGKLSRPPLNLPTFSTNRYDPLVGSSWPQNNVSMAEKVVPSACSSCHEKDGPGGRFPLLSTDIKKGYCAILARAVEKTMPPNNPGSLKDDAEIKTFLQRCDDAPDVTNADPGP
ncbi:hypothetical protein G6K93_31615 [Agrobacterium rhizogenes]|nr:hypothetical protein [Rhizobium rhizogenes]